MIPCTAIYQTRKPPERQSCSVCLWCCLSEAALWCGVCQGLDLEVEARDVYVGKQGLLGDCPEEKARGEQDKPIDIAAIMSHSLSELLNTSAEQPHSSEGSHSTEEKTEPQG